MPIVNELLAQTTNYLPWVVAGLFAWAFAYWHLEDVGSQTLGDLVTLILSVIPLGITVITIDVGVARWNGNRYFQAAIFLLLGVASLLYFVMMYFGLTRL